MPKLQDTEWEKNTLKLQSKCYRCKLEKLNLDILHICNINNKCLVGNQGMPSIISTWLHGTFEKLSHIHMKNVLMKFWLVFSHAKHSRSVGTLSPAELSNFKRSSRKHRATDSYKAPALEYKFELRFMYYLADSSHSAACSTEIRIKQIALILTRSPAKSSWVNC